MALYHVAIVKQRSSVAAKYFEMTNIDITAEMARGFYLRWCIIISQDILQRHVSADALQLVRMCCQEKKIIVQRKR